MTDALGVARARAVAEKDDGAVRSLLHEDLDFRAMTPGRIWEAASTDEVLGALHLWFEDSDEIDELVAVESDDVADTSRVGYRLRVHNPDGEHLVEQQAYWREADGRINYLRIMCSGYRRIGD